MQEDDKLTETLARMWIECDPNRAGNPLGSGFHPDDPMTNDAGDMPRWRWFIPRAEATVKYLKEHGYKIVRA